MIWFQGKVYLHVFRFGFRMRSVGDLALKSVPSD